MSLHNVLALKAARSLVHLVHAGGEWRQTFSGDNVSLGYLRSATAWPVPDAVLMDDVNDDTTYCAIEFKPPNSSKSECVRGLGQTITYLAEYDSAALILPDRADDGYQIAQHIADLISRPAAAQTRVGVYAYPVAAASPSLTAELTIELLKPVGGLAPELRTPGRPRLERTFWAFWRDVSLHEMFLVLDRADRLAGDASIREQSLAFAFEEYAALRTIDPQGNPRQSAGITEHHFKGNTAITLSHLGLWEDDGALTEAGRRLVHTGRLFGHASAPFRDAFARQALLAGRHYEFVKLVYEFQREHPGAYRRADEFAQALETSLEDDGS